MIINDYFANMQSNLAEPHIMVHMKLKTIIFTIYCKIIFEFILLVLIYYKLYIYMDHLLNSDIILLIVIFLLNSNISENLN
jgi:hypothetical protein